ncbi:MAG: cell division protein FtsZ, partial [Hyphococcus sp.]
MPLNLSVPELTELKPRISVIGVGGAGGNAVNNMIESQLEGVEFVVANTDAQAVGLSKADKKIQLGVKTTQGLGAGSIPDIGQAAAEESIDEILEHVGNCHMLFVTAGMGGGTGTGAAPVIAKAAKERDILTVGVVTKPFHFEGARRMRIAAAGIEELQKHVDTLLIIPNQNLFSIANERTTFHEAFAMADQVLHSGVRGITDLMVMPGLINLDFADVRTVMSEMGKAMMGTGEAEGEKRAIQAAEAAISNPLLDEVSMKGARGVLINITGSMDMTLFEVDEAANRIRAEVDPDANIIVGSTFNQDLEGRVRVSVVATGIDIDEKENRPHVKINTAAIAKPWREPLVVKNESSAKPAAQPAASVASSPDNAASKTAVAARQVPTQSAAPASVSASANPVGDVHERIRRMLTEGSAAPAAG